LQETHLLDEKRRGGVSTKKEKAPNKTAGQRGQKKVLLVRQDLAKMKSENQETKKKKSESKIPGVQLLGSLENIEKGQVPSEKEETTSDPLGKKGGVSTGWETAKRHLSRGKTKSVQQNEKKKKKNGLGTAKTETREEQRTGEWKGS